MPVPGVQLRPFFRGAGRQAAIVPGESGAEDLAVLVSLRAPVSAGRPPISPELVGVLELTAAPVVATVGSGWRQTRARGTHWNHGVTIELEWPLITAEQRESFLSFMRVQVGLGGGGPALRAITIDVDGADVPDSAVEVLIVDVPDDVETLLERIQGTVGLYRFGPLRAVELLT